MRLPYGDYGKELVMDLHECSTENFDKRGLREYFEVLCAKINMDQEQAHFWEFPGGEENSEAPLAHMKGVSALQFIKTSSIVVHTVDELKKIYINIFSCKDFDADLTVNFTASFFDGTVKQQKILQRS